MFLKLFVSLCLLASIAGSAGAQTLNESSLGLYGCDLSNISASSSNPDLVLIVCGSSPKSVYFSPDFGETWVYASGGEYLGRQALQVLVGDQHAFLIANTSGAPKLFRAALPSGNAAAWQPDWQALTLTAQPAAMVAGNGKLYVTATGSGNVMVVDQASGTQEGTSEIQANATYGKSLALDGTTLYASVIQNDGSSVLYKVALSVSGAMAGSWTTVAAAGIPAGKAILSIAVSPNHYLYGSVYTPSSPTNFFGSGIYISRDEGATFEVANATLSFSKACFSGNNHVMGYVRSLDAGSSFSSIGQVSTAAGPVNIRGNACLFHASDGNKFFQQSWRGLLKTTEFNAMSPVYADISTGLEAVTVYEIAQSGTDKNRVVAATTSGVATTGNFTESAPSWTWICPGGTCYQTPRVAADQIDSSIFYVVEGARVYKGQASGSGGATTYSWSELILTPGGEIRALRNYAFMPEQLVVSHACMQNQNPNGGALQFYNKTNASLIKESLDEQCVGDFIALNQNTMFVMLGAHYQASPSLENRGIFRSTNGGTSWAVMSDADLGSLTLFDKFAYDTTSDILYATSTSPVGIYSLSGAAAGSTNWSKLAQPSGLSYVTAIAVDPSTARLFVAGSASIMMSTDHGSTWTTVFTGLPEEFIKTLYFDDLVKGSDAGLSAVLIPTPAPGTCKLRWAKKVGRFAFPATYNLSLTYTGSLKSGLLEYKAAKKRTWKRLKTLTITKSPLKVSARLRGKGSQRVTTSDCTTKALKVG